MSYAVSGALQAAIYGALQGDATLTGLVGSAIYDAPPSGALPGLYVTLGAERVREASDGSGAGAWHDLTVAVVTGAAGFSAAKAVAGAVSDLLQARPILALDEPFAALGPALKVQMLDLVQEVAGELGALVLLVSHDPQDARRFAEETVLVAEGVAHPPVETQALFDAPPEALRAYLGQ